MGTILQHREKAEHNQEFLDRISRLGFPDWTATAIFYKAVHLVEMMFAADGIHTTSHTERNQRLLKHHPNVYQEFRPLYNFSRYARYDCMMFKRTSLPECFARLAVIEEKTDKYIRGRPASS